MRILISWGNGAYCTLRVGHQDYLNDVTDLADLIAQYGPPILFHKVGLDKDGYYFCLRNDAIGRLAQSILIGEPLAEGVLLDAMEEQGRVDEAIKKMKEKLEALEGLTMDLLSHAKLKPYNITLGELANRGHQILGE